MARGTWMKGSAMAASAVASTGLTVAMGRSVAVGTTMVGTGSGVAVGAGVDVMGGRGVGDVVGVAAAVGTRGDGVAGVGVVVGMDMVDVLSCAGAGCSCVGVAGVVRRGGTVGVAGMGAADSRRDPHPLRTSKAMLAPNAS